MKAPVELMQSGSESENVKKKPVALTEEELTQVSCSVGGADDPKTQYEVGQNIQIYLAASMTNIHGRILDVCSYLASICKYRVFVEEYGYAVNMSLDNPGDCIRVL